MLFIITSSLLCLHDDVLDLIGIAEDQLRSVEHDRNGGTRTHDLRFIGDSNKIYTCTTTLMLYTAYTIESRPLLANHLSYVPLNLLF